MWLKIKNVTLSVSCMENHSWEDYLHNMYIVQLINLENNKEAIKKGQSRKTGNIHLLSKTKKKQNKNTIQYVLDAIIRK